MSRPIEVLLIEDSPSDADLTLSNFRHSALTSQVHWVTDGDSAMDFLHQRGEYGNAIKPDLILLDLNLPGMSGQEVLEAVKSDPRLKMIPVVVLTTSENETDIRRAYESSANCYITKPVDLQQFVRVIQLISDFWLTAVKLPPLD